MEEQKQGLYTHYPAVSHLPSSLGLSFFKCCFLLSWGVPSGLRTEVRGCEIKQLSRSTGSREINHKENDLGRVYVGFGLICSGHGGNGGGELRPEAGSRVSQPQLLMVSGSP